MSTLENDRQDNEVAVKKSVWRSLRRVWPYFNGLRSAWLLTVVATVAASATEPMIPAMMQPLLDSGFTKNALQLWKVRLVLLLLFCLWLWLVSLGLLLATEDSDVLIFFFFSG